MRNNMRSTESNNTYYHIYMYDYNTLLHVVCGLAQFSSNGHSKAIMFCNNIYGLSK